MSDVPSQSFALGDIFMNSTTTYNIRPTKEFNQRNLNINPPKASKNVTSTQIHVTKYPHSPFFLTKPILANVI